MEGIIGFIKHKYVILGDKRHMFLTSVCNHLLPGDKVSYKVNENNMIIIDSLLERATQTHLGIVKNVDKNDIQLSIPGLPKNVEFTYSLLAGIQQHSVCILYFSQHNTHIVQHYDSIRNRANDVSLFYHLYQSHIEGIEPEYEVHKPCINVAEIKDLTHLPTFAVDPPRCKDHDDAISVSGNKIYVHIVDAHHQIEPLSQIDKYALQSSFTLYLTTEYISNILPTELAEDKLSLCVNKERLTITVEYEIDPETYDIIRTSIYRATISVKTQYDYDNYIPCPFVNAFVQRWGYRSLLLPNVTYNVDAKTGELTSTTCTIHDSSSHKAIETLMILTNLSISKHTNSAIAQRYHQKPQNALPLVAYTNNPVINALLSVKNYRAAVYDTHFTGHFGLGLDTYTHFTSPIRRYMDVIVHRYLCGVSYTNLPEILEHINKREIFIEKIVNLYETVKLLSYFTKNADKVWDAYVLYMTPVGACVVLSENMYECFVFSQEKYQTGLKIQVKIKTVDWTQLSVKVVIV